MEDDVSSEAKTSRITELLRIQRQISTRKYREDLGKRVEVMLEGPSKSNANLWTGRSRKNRLMPSVKNSRRAKNSRRGVMVVRP
jgi:tRNA-2-methylthio-N6-dimethylallyladenosine synthase